MKPMTNYNLIGLIIILFLVSCSSKIIDYNTIVSFDESQNLKAVIEIPAGTNDKIEFNPEKNTFEIDSLDGNARTIEFLPYPVNYGFIPSTKMVKSKNGDGDALDVLVLGKPVKTGQVISVKPIALFKMMDDGEKDHKILSIPTEAKHQIILIDNFEDLSQNHPKIRDMIADWFLNHDKSADIQILGWFDETKAVEEVMYWQTNKK
jgi:inorganic pyrophosphatase